LAAGVVLTAAAAVLSAWRWTLVARGLGQPLRLRDAVPAYYRSMLLNVTLPGGVLGDVDRGVGQGRGAGDVGTGLRVVAWERCAGQVVLVVLGLTVLVALPSPLRAWVPGLLAALAVAVVAVGVVALGAAVVGRRSGRGPGGSWATRLARTVSADLGALRARGARAAVVLASVGVVVCTSATFLVAARTAGVTLPSVRVVPLALAVLVAMAVPLGVAGWGPREGAAGALFAASGQGAGVGVATTTVYGVMVLVAVLPGVVVLVADRRRRRRRPVVAAQGAADG
jgi:uncharacterized membrane protein YbhN (UPF0104 family)